MHIAFTTTEYITESNFDGGIANYLYRTALALVQMGHQVEVFTKATVEESFFHNGIAVHRVKPDPHLYHWIRFFTRGRYVGIIEILTLAWAFRRRILKRHKTTPFDIIQAASYLATGVGLLHFFPIPVVVRASSYEPLLRTKNRNTENQSNENQRDGVSVKSPKTLSRAEMIRDKLESYTFRHCKAIYAPSQFLAQHLESELQLPVRVIRPTFMIETVEWDHQYAQHILEQVQHQPYLLYFGAINVLKGAGIITAALPDLLAALPDLHLVMVGKEKSKKADQHPILDEIFRQAGLSQNRIHYLGPLYHAQLYPVIASARAIVLPSLVDNLPNTCLEAMALGRVVIGTSGTSLDELIDDNVTGKLVPPNDANSLAHVVKTVWAMSDTQRTSIGEAAKAKIARYSPENTCPILEQFYRDVIDNYPNLN